MREETWRLGNRGSRRGYERAISEQTGPLYAGTPHCRLEINPSNKEQNKGPGACWEARNRGHGRRSLAPEFRQLTQPGRLLEGVVSRDVHPLPHPGSAHTTQRR